MIFKLTIQILRQKYKKDSRMRKVQK